MLIDTVLFFVRSTPTTNIDTTVLGSDSVDVEKYRYFLVFIIRRQKSNDIYNSIIIIIDYHHTKTIKAATSATVPCLPGMDPVLQATFAENLVAAALPLLLTNAENANTMYIPSAQCLAAIRLRALGRDTHVSSVQGGAQLHHHQYNHHE